MSRQPRTQAQTTQSTTRQNEYFVPRDGIDREVISADICRYLGNDALVRPGQYDNPQNGQTVHGYYITAYRNLTTAMIEDLKADSARWENERRAQTRNTGVQYRYSETHQSRQHHGPTENPFPPDPYNRDGGYENPRYPGTGAPGFTGASAPYSSPPPPQQQQQQQQPYQTSSGGPYAVGYQQNQQVPSSERFQSGQPASMLRPGYQTSQDPPYIGTGANLPHSGYASSNEHYGSRLSATVSAPPQPLYASAPPSQPPYPATSSPFQQYPNQPPATGGQVYGGVPSHESFYGRVSPAQAPQQAYAAQGQQYDATPPPPPTTSQTPTAGSSKRRNDSDLDRLHRPPRR
ncbi:hypothetical protein L249_8184 [Ophiocordyceps polyrhachis-furcata BCC 54312]|uniref:Transcription factor RfeG n=1 Tax=Ophiocordyceps polyrhachis-furcata BCC 54312 TaxID=1330021 RepID=A0A367LI63_9HYPO|nr:hypothetical protein L249_8184 [Ophiocordyceps polyrhachis-furcata BCC 54312]